MKQLIRNTGMAVAVFSLAAVLSAGITACDDSGPECSVSGTGKREAAEVSVPAVSGQERSVSGPDGDSAADGPAVIDDSVELDPLEDCEASVYFGDISSLSADMQAALRERFPKQTKAAEAEVLFCTQDELCRSAELRECRERGACIVIVKPEYGKDERKASSKSFGVSDELPGGDLLFHASRNNNQEYSVYGEHGVEDDLAAGSYDVEEANAYCGGRVTPLVHWLNKNLENKQPDSGLSLKALNSASADSSGYDYDSMVTNIDNEGKNLSANFPFSLCEPCEKCYTRQCEHTISAASSFDVNFKVYPLYMQSCNGDKAGDYYAVTCAITPYNQNMWRTWHCSTGIVSEVYMVGYWFKHMATTIRLLDKNGVPVSGVKYYRTPVPENAINSRSYSNGTSDTISGSVSGGFASGNPAGSVTASFSHTVNSSTNYSMDDIDYTLDSSTNQPHYDYDSKNVHPSKSDDWDRYWPKNCRTQWTVRQSWIWFVPRGTAGVDDNSDTSFTLSFDGLLQYSNYSWMYCPTASDKAGGVKTFTPIWVKNHTWDMPAPDRRTWGMITIKNAANNALSNIKFFRKGEEDKEPAARLDMSYNIGEIAEIALPEGEYTVTFETIDPDKYNQKLADWMFENVKVKQGRNKAAATTALSSVNAKIIE
ncbi:MAG: hypothetical protein Q4F00_02995 [bacterium]|nr:hypothetical protein [bacterium]